MKCRHHQNKIPCRACLVSMLAYYTKDKEKNHDIKGIRKYIESL